MKAQGAGEDNAEYAKLHGILAAVQHQHLLQKQRQLQAQQQQQQQQQSQNDAATSVNTVIGECQIVGGSGVT